MPETSWTQSALDTNMHKVHVEHKRGFEFWVLLRSDAHHDNAHCRHDLEKKHLELAKQRNAAILDFGDLFCAMQGPGDRRASKDALRDENSVDHYFDSLVQSAANFYEPYTKNWVLFGKGNHETSALKHNGTDLTDRLVHELNLRQKTNLQSGGYSGWVWFQFQRGNQKSSRLLKYHHGSGGGGPVTKGVIRTNRDASYLGNADIVCSGHVHEQWHVIMPREDFNTFKRKSEVSTVHHLCVPTYKDEYGSGEGGFHIEKGRPPKPLGCWWLRFFEEDHDTGKIGMQVIADTTF